MKQKERHCWSVEIEYTKEAQQDLEQIEFYIIETFKSPLTAVDNILKIMNAIDLLSTNPFMGKDLQKFLEDYRKEYEGKRLIVKDQYIVIYHIYEDIIWIDRVIGGGQDIFHLF
jgi:addiction module RelE/StbE family toxin